MDHANLILNVPYDTCTFVVILASMKQNQNTEEAHAGKHMHLCKDKTRKKNNKNMHITNMNKNIICTMNNYIASI